MQNINNKRNIVLIFIIITILISKVQSQGFINGSFEITTGNCDYNNNNFNFNALMSNCYGFGADGLDVINSTCGYGTAQNGNYFVGIAFHGTSFKEAFSLALSSPLIAGQVYTLSFYNKKDLVYPTNKLKIGYSSDSLSFGTLIDSVPLPNTAWTNEILTFTPSINSSFITVAAVDDSVTSWNHVDNFTLTNTTEINDILAAQHLISIYPNPTQNILNVTLARCEMIAVINTLGVIVMEKTCSCLHEGKMELDVSSLLSGIYFVKAGNEVRKFVKE